MSGVLGVVSSVDDAKAGLKFIVLILGLLLNPTGFILKAYYNITIAKLRAFYALYT